MKRLVLILPLLGCLAQPTAQSSLELECPPVTSSIPLSTGDVFTAKLRSITINNGIVRLRYGAHTMDFRDTGVTQENVDRHLDHVLAARHTDDLSVAEQGCLGACHDGTHWHDAVYPRYGDGTKFATAELSHDADRMHVLWASDEAIELAYEWDNVRLDGLRSARSCQLGTYPECGPTMKDADGNPVYYRDGETIKSVRSVRLWKTVRVERCTPGYYAALRSDPPLIWPEQGSRAMRLGYITSTVVWNCDRSLVVRHPNVGGHTSLGVSNCIADIPVQLPGHEGWPFARFMLTPRPVAFNSLQYSTLQLGSPGTESLWDSVGDDGRPRQWQVFIGAIEYTHNNLASEPSPFVRDLVNGAAATVVWE